MSTRFCHITPFQFFPFSKNYSECFLTLAHLVESHPVYVEQHLKAYQEFDELDLPYTKIMDNSGYEFYKEYGPGYVFDPGKLLELSNMVKADYIVAPDYPGQDWRKTQDAMNRFYYDIRKFSHKYVVPKIFYVPQSAPGDLDGYITAFEKVIIPNSMVKYIGVSILAAPIAYGAEKTPMSFVARTMLMHELHDRGLLDAAKKNGIKIHFLGMLDGPREIELVSPFIDYIDSWDSSAAAQQALVHDANFDNSLTGIRAGKSPYPVDFELEYDSDLLHKAAQLVKNCQHINNLITSVSAGVR